MRALGKYEKDDTTDIARALSSCIIKFKGVIHEVQGRYYLFYYGESRKKTLFASFILTEKVLKVRIRTDPAGFFKDPARWTEDIGLKGYLLWFLGKQPEREFSITRKGQIEYAMELITQAYLQTALITERRPLDRHKSVVAVMKEGWKRF